MPAMPQPKSSLLADRVVIVSGIGPGLGRQAALALARAGAHVVMGSRTRSALESLAAEITDDRGSCAYAVCDTTADDDCARLVALAEARYGALDCVVANAFHKGAMTVTIEDADLDNWREVFEVNVLGSLRMAKAALPALRRRGGGSIVFVNSQIIRRPKATRGDYAATKAALLSAAQTLAREVGRDGIRVNTVVPGRMWGPPLMDFTRAAAAASGRSFDEHHQELIRDMALPYIASDEEVARVVVFLASDLAVGMTGQSVDVNAGETFH